MRESRKVVLVVAKCAPAGTAGRRPENKLRNREMKEDHETRRKIIRQWMALPKDKRQTEEQVVAFAKKAVRLSWSVPDPRQFMSDYPSNRARQ
jgi:hypothetical protein